MKRSLGWVLVATVAIATIGPLLWVVLCSLKPSQAVLASPFGVEGVPHVQNYQEAWNEAKIGRSFLNSIVVSLATLLVLLPMGSMAAYAISRMNFFGKKMIRNVFLAGLMFPNFLAVVPLFLLMSSWGLAGKLYGLVIVYVAYSLSFTVFVMSGFFEALPAELEEAARLDGAGQLKLFWNVMLPLARPGLIVVGIFNFIGLWNEYNLAKVLVQGDDSTLPLNLATLTTAQFYKADFGALFAALVLAVVPLLFLYSLFKDSVHEAMLKGAIR